QQTMPTAWYTYDSVNRIRVSQGNLVNGSIVLGDLDWNTGLSRSSVLTYDAMGNRRSALSYNNFVQSTETYEYDLNGRLKVTRADGFQTSWRDYDAADRVIQQISYYTQWNNGVPTVHVNENRQNTYDPYGSGRLQQQTVRDENGWTKQTTTYTWYDL